MYQRAFWAMACAAVCVQSGSFLSIVSTVYTESEIKNQFEKTLSWGSKFSVSKENSMTKFEFDVNVKEGGIYRACYQESSGNDFECGFVTLWPAGHKGEVTIMSKGGDPKVVLIGLAGGKQIRTSIKSPGTIVLVIVACVIGAVVLCCAVGCGCFFWQRSRNKRRQGIRDTNSRV